MQSKLVFVELNGATTVSRQVGLDHQYKGVRQINLLAYSYVGDFGVETAALINIDGIGTDISTEGLIGFPVPLIAQSRTTGPVREHGGHVFSPPLKIGTPTRSAMTALRVSVTRTDGATALNFDSFGIWLELMCEPEHVSYDDVRDRQFISPLMPATGANDWRWDWQPPLAEAREQMARLESRFSNQVSK